MSAATSLAMGRANTALAAGMAQVAGVLTPAAIGYGAVQSMRRFADAELAVERIGITAGATSEETRSAFGIIQKAAHDYAMTQDEVTEGLGTLVSTGRDMKDALAFLPSVTATAQASGSAIVDIANTADAVGRNFNIAGQDMQKAFDILVAGGKAGMFELRDMSAYLPSLAPAYQALGYSGEEGLQRMVATLQVLRAGSGTAEQAAAAAMNVFSKINANETASSFKKFGVDLRKELEKGKREGRDLIEVFTELTRKTVKGDLAKLPQLFGDQEMQIGMRALLNNTEMFAEVMGKLGRSQGATAQDLGRVLDMTSSKVQQLTTSWDKLVQSIGSGIAPAAVPAMDAISDAINLEVDYRRGIEREEKAGGSYEEAFAAYRAEYEKVHGEHWQGDFYAPMIAAFKEDMARYARGEQPSPLTRVNQDVVTKRRGNSTPFGPDLPDLGVTRRGGAIPVPQGAPGAAARAQPNSGMSQAAQRAAYAEARLLSERMARTPTERVLDMSARRASEVQARAGAAGEGRALPPPAGDRFGGADPGRFSGAMPDVGGTEALRASVDRLTAAMQAANSGRGGQVGDGLGRSTGALATPSARPDVAEPARQEASIAQQIFETAAQAMQTVMSFTVAPGVDTSGIDAAMSKTDALAAKLRALPALAAQAAQATANANNAAGRQAGRVVRSQFSDGGV